MSESNEELRAEVVSLVEETQRHLLWLRDSGVKTMKRADAAPAIAHDLRPAPAPTDRARPAFLGEPPKPRSPEPRPPPPAPATAVVPPPPKVELPPPPPSPEMSTPPAPVPSAASRDVLTELRLIRQDLGRCERCQLSRTRNTIVWGQGNPEAELVFVGEAPGEDEDLSGIPFVGKAGQLLTKMIEAMGYTRDDVYICNILKCRPPGNRTPEQEEVDQCRPFVERQLLAIRPKVIVLLGGTASKALLRTNTGIMKLRNQWHEWNGIPVMPTFHPSYLLREPGEKAKAWDDLKLVLAKLGRPTRR